MTPLSPEPDFETLREHVASDCIHCGRCERECAFLQRYGDPGSIAAGYRPDAADLDDIPFSCSLCGLCTAVCPRQLPMGELFLAMRRAIVARGRGRFSGHRGLLTYERLGRSRWLSGHFLPPGCDTVYFPGCALPGGRSGITLALIDHLRTLVPNLGVVLGCCGKPSHDLGRQADFEGHFERLRASLERQGIRRILVNCPNCHVIFRRYATEFETETVYERLAAGPLPASAQLSGAVLVHDPCVMRDHEASQKAVRALLDRLGEWIDPVKHSGRLTRCCGEGGAVHGVNPRLAKTWALRHAREVHGERLVTYCAGCAQLLSRHTPTSHILDLLFSPQRALAGRLKTSPPPFSYLRRWQLKRRLGRLFKG